MFRNCLCCYWGGYETQVERVRRKTPIYLANILIKLGSLSENLSLNNTLEFNQAGL
jgi:hypothetical protein